MTMRGPHFRKAHVTEAALLDHVEQRLNDDSHRDIQRHLADCHRCRSEAADLLRLVEDLRAESRDSPPPHLAAWARMIPELVAPRTRPGWLKLVADTWADLAGGALASIVSLQPTPMLRGVDIPHRAGRRRLLFAAGRFDLDMEIGYPGADDPRHIHGQVLPVGQTRHLWTDCDVHLTRGRAAYARTRLDRRGEFVFPRVLAGRYHLTLTGPAPARTPSFEV
ncbi:MAG: hypothetical protein SGI90_01510 [Candidatus Eisenbacteria bacterium]|nr:hypothetical protein [Candidatus Eisenbacteria bacterium]